MSNPDREVSAIHCLDNLIAIVEVGDANGGTYQRTAPTRTYH